MNLLILELPLSMRAIITTGIKQTELNSGQTVWHIYKGTAIKIYKCLLAQHEIMPKSWQTAAELQIRWCVCVWEGGGGGGAGVIRVILK